MANHISTTNYLIEKGWLCKSTLLLHRNIDQTLMNSLHGLLNCEIGGLDCPVITTEYRTRVHCIHSHVTHILQCISPCNLFRSFRPIFVYNTNLTQLNQFRKWWKPTNTDVSNNNLAVHSGLKAMINSC